MTNDPRRDICRLERIGYAAIALFVFGAGGWAATSELSGAVIGAGTVVVESSLKKVQHPTGGIVGALFVKEGSAVEAGQVVMRLDETVTRATLGIVRSQLDELMARQARLNAERDGLAEAAVPDALTGRVDEPGVALALASETRLLESRYHARAGQRAQLTERIAQIREEISGVSGQRDAKDRERALIREELAGVDALYAKNLVSIQRVMQLRREEARITGERNQLTADIARARGRISEIALQILQLDQDFRTEVLKELRDAQGRIAELKERLTASEDQLRRIDIRAPQSGTVHQLATHTVGGVVAAGETVMMIVPHADELVIEAKISPTDIDQVVVGAAALVRIMAGNQRTTPELRAEVVRLSPDLSRDPQTNQAYYTLRATLAAGELDRLGGLKLVPGMPAEVFVQTGERTPLQYLVKPLKEQIARAFRER